MRIYVACLAAYNAGHLHGAWIELEDVITVHSAIQSMLESSPIPNAEEWAIHDYEAPFNIGEYDDIFQICEKVDFIAVNGGPAIAALAVSNNDLTQAQRFYDQHYLGTYNSFDDFAYEQFDWNALPDWAHCYIDLDQWATTLKTEYSWHEIDNEVHIFS